MEDPAYPAFPVFALLGFFLVLVPLPWHFQAWNAGTCLYMIWTALACLNQFINSIVWHDNALNPAPVWCDISSRFIIGSSIAIPVASLCINRRLYKIATANTLMVTRAQKRRAVMEDLALGVGIPVIEMCLQYVVSGHRFNILEDIGCFPVSINVWLAYVLVATWPVIVGMISAVYCILTLRAFYKRNVQFKQLVSSNSSLTINRYFRLMALATADLLCTTPFGAYSIYLNLTAEPLSPYRGWADLHFDYSRVDQIPATLWRLNHKTVISVELSRWMLVVCALMFFLFFGFAEEARRNYKNTFLALLKILHIRPESLCFRRERKPVLLPFGLSPSPEKKSNVATIGGTGRMPMFIARPRGAVTRDSFPIMTQSESNEKLVRSDSVISPSNISASTTTLVLPPLSKTETKEAESPTSECYGHAY